MRIKEITVKVEPFSVLEDDHILTRLKTEVTVKKTVFKSEVIFAPSDFVSMFDHLFDYCKANLKEKIGGCS